ncbi:glycoside hydrolase family 92 protein [Nonlabens sp. Ci31]|uniref:GH92 family glycosyl hydrolase n=1 Tax=Nonlabens sp. Ci31 TaxID=2608253 RepID=UPI001464912F|nr:GH92 family glycosyl hydrolase [Nonlabens sp. Ci31]QJP33272.1 glycoside hydrolase family 92 protein [Nonlabens sp. Ci31]
MKTRFYSFLMVIAATISSCKEDSKVDFSPAAADRPLTEYVNTFIGTGGHGHTYPGATMPFGMMQLSPDTRLDGWDGCSGYHYSDDVIYGFSHTHLSGTGVSDYGDILFMPTNKPIVNNGADGKEGYSSKFSHDNEKASPGYYEVHLEDTDIDVRLTVTERAGMHEYKFPSSEDQYVILDLEHRDKLLVHDLQFTSDTEITGKRFSSAWATNQMLFFYIKTSHPIKNWNTKYEVTPKKIALDFENPDNQPVTMKIGISPVDEAGAKQNLETEIGNKDFETIKKAANATWEKQLNKILIEDENQDNKVNFYSALYHTMMAPNLYQDVDGRYRGMDLEIHKNKDFDYYTVFSMWDTYRAAHPLYTIIEQKRTNDFINTLTAKYDEGGILPIWDLSGNYTGCMIGYHGVPIIADAYLKGIRDYDIEKAFEAMMHSANQDKLGLESYKKYGFIPVELESESVSKTLEYAYDDWTIAQMAKAMDNEEKYIAYTRRAQNYKNMYNPATGFLQGRYRNTWFAPFKPEEVNFNYTEANAWQYSLYTPQDISGHINLMGGNEAYEKHLDNMFTAKTRTSGRHQADITGLIGQYAHGNEPSHHIAYLYNFIGKPHKTQEKVHEILTTLYHNVPDGISGNEDCGQMSAWYILSSLGFYPVTPGSNEYIIGTPLFHKATINLENNRKFTVITNGTGKYISGIKWNKYIPTMSAKQEPKYEKYSKSFITHDMIARGGTLVFEMSKEPTAWATAMEDRPVSAITEELITAVPYIESGNISFSDTTTITLNTIDPEAEIFYSINGSDFELYESPIPISEPIKLSVNAVKDDKISRTLTTDFYKYDKNMSIVLAHDYANEYSAGGNDALIDGMKGTEDFRSGSWQGTLKEDVIAMVDLGSSKDLNQISTSFLKDQRSWIFYPKSVRFELYDESKKLIKTLSQRLPKTGKEEVVTIHDVQLKTTAKNIRFVKMTAVTYGTLPEWHLGYPYDGKAWIFVDEITVK